MPELMEQVARNNVSIIMSYGTGKKLKLPALLTVSVDASLNDVSNEARLQCALSQSVKTRKQNRITTGIDSDRMTTYLLTTD